MLCLIKSDVIFEINKIATSRVVIILYHLEDCWAVLWCFLDCLD